MAKKPRERCHHGNAPLYVQGCPTCAETACRGLFLCRDNGWTFEELWYLLHKAFPTQEVLDKAIKEVRLDIARQKRLEARNG